MEALRIFKTVTDDRVEELNQYKGRKVEIIILADVSKEKEKSNWDILNELKGSCPDLPDGMEFQKKIRKEQRL